MKGSLELFQASNDIHDLRDPLDVNGLPYGLGTVAPALKRRTSSCPTYGRAEMNLVHFPLPDDSRQTFGVQPAAGHDAEAAGRLADQRPEHVDTFEGSRPP